MDKRLASKEWRLGHLYKIRDKYKKLVVFERNRAQRDYAKKAWFRNIILKSRQLGFTTDETIDTLDDTLYHPNFDALIIAHDLDSADAIFDKKTYLAWQNYHEVLKRGVKVEQDQARTLKFGFLDGGFSSISVDTSGRSGTFSRVHITEFAKIAKARPDAAEEIISGTIPAVPAGGRADIESTAYGAKGLFYEMFWQAWKRGEPKYPEEFRAHFYNWRWDEEIDLIDDPEKKLPAEFKEYQKQYKLDDWEITYYYRKWLSLSEDWEMLRREYPTTPEEAFSSLIQGVIYAGQIGRMRQEGRLKMVPYDRSLKVHTVWDIGVGPNLACGFYQRVGHEPRMIDYWQGAGKEGLPEACREVQRKPYVYGKHFFPHDINATETGTGKTRRDTAERLLGAKIHLVPEVSLNDGILAGGLFLDRLWVSIPACEVWLNGNEDGPGITEYRWKLNAQLGVYTKDPVHDAASHKGDINRYAALVENDMTNEVPPKFKQSAYVPQSEYETT